MSGDARDELLEALGGRGERSRTTCGCEWVRLPRGGVRLRGVLITGDVLVRRCEWHEWYAGLTEIQQCEASRQRREVDEGRACGA